MYKEVYSWRLLDELTEGKTIYCLDKKRKTVESITGMKVNGFLTLLNELKVEPRRFLLWEETEEENNG